MRKVSRTLRIRTWTVLGLVALAVWVCAVASVAWAQLLATGRFVLVPEQSRVEVFVRDNVGGFRAWARQIEGDAVVRQTGERSFLAELTVSVPARSVTTGLGLRDNQMHRDVLRSDEYPTISFQGMVTTDAARVIGTFPAMAHGRLTLRGVTRPISVPVQITPLPDGFRGRAEFELRMSEYGIPVPRFLFFVAEDVVKVTVDLRLRAANRS